MSDADADADDDMVGYISGGSRLVSVAASTSFLLYVAVTLFFIYFFTDGRLAGGETTEVFSEIGFLFCFY